MTRTLDADYILDGEFLLCLMCRRWMYPAPRGDRTRAYSCGPLCPRQDVEAAPLETRVELAALVRAVTVLCPGLARVRHLDAGLDLVRHGAARPGPEEVRRWQWCDLSDRRALVRAASARLELDEAGNLHPVRHP